ncbi:MAG: glycosyltransferase family 4 protein [Chlorobium sp.]|uniref:glycosyltransferase family 4 protein n=1 Tax=Chlorobium sp. TaxID=1095 RepID=UPI0025C6987B|nr:glycosyltransferase family 1 protein [Chlorobium sp.]MCF8383974.1 glycosyltransferase family 4 protein [Chlorobium sp.]
MHIAFDISQTGSGKAGCGYFAHAMIEAVLELSSGNHFSLLPSFGDFWFDTNMPVHNPYKNRHSHYGPRHHSHEEAGHFWKQPNVEAALGNSDIIHSNNFWCPTQLQSSRLIYTFYDMAFAVNPEWTTETNRVNCFEGVFRSSIVADWVVAISKASRAHYLEVFPHFPEDRIRVIYPCSRFSDSFRKGKRPEALEKIPTGEFWLNVGTIEPRKNQYHLAEAYAGYAQRVKYPMPLVLAGGKGWLMDGFLNHLRKLGIADSIIMAGYVSDDELIWLYRNCYANLYPSLFEGFGLPVLEGMQFGAPTITSKTTSIPEVAGDAALLLDPKDYESWVEALLCIGGNWKLRNEMSKSARNRAKKFNWEQSATALLQLYNEAFASPKRKAIE